MRFTASANVVWAYDFVFEAAANGQQIKCLTIIDEFTHECFAIDGAGSIRSKRVIDLLSRLISLHGAPQFLRSDRGPEFVSRVILTWHRTQSVLFPERLNDWVEQDNAVRVVDAFVDALDLGQLGFERAQPAETGRPAYPRRRH